ncbi:MAG: putative lipid II flippase FtsW [Deltaproteobacteria bacterium]|nr:putative lipid II flippase FtsW [Deltaproteobacteria bacterium]
MRFDDHRPLPFVPGRVDPWTAVLPCLLAFWGVVMVYSATVVTGAEALSNHYLAKQLLFSLAGVVAMVVVTRIDYRKLGKPRFVYLLLFATVALLVLVHIEPFGARRGGASRWIDLGFTSFQPSELAKAVVVIFLASSVARKGEEKMSTWRFGIAPHLLIPGVVVGLFMTQPDFGSTAILCLIIGVMLYVGGARISHLVLLAAPALVGAAAAIITAPYRLKRILAFWNPWADPRGSGYQVIESLVAVGSGGVWGRGLGDGRQKLKYLPEIHTDFIFSNIAEEAGLIGVAITMVLFAILVIRGMRIARRAPDPFGRYLAWGVSSLLGLEIVLNLGVVMSLLPTKGLALPFLSYGGTSVVISFMLVGLLLSVSRWSEPESAR